MRENHSRVYKIDGVGVSLSRFHPCAPEERLRLRGELGYSEGDFIITVVAELNRNKNQMMLVRSVPRLRTAVQNLKILLVGKETLPMVRRYVGQEHLSDSVRFLGYRNDVEKLTMISDIAFSASLREGLPVNIIEAMACGVPVVCSDNRGHRSLVRDKETGLIFSTDSEKEMTYEIVLLYKNPCLRAEMGRRSVVEAQKYDVDASVRRMSMIYSGLMGTNQMGGGATVE